MNTVQIETTRKIVDGFDATRDEFWTNDGDRETGEPYITEIFSVESGVDGICLHLEGIGEFTPTERQLAQICRAVGIKQFEDPEDLLFRPIVCRVADEKIVGWHFPDEGRFPIGFIREAA